MFYTAGATLIRQNTVNYATLQDWKNGQNWDYNSIVYTPAFAAGNELQPDVTNPDVWAMHGRGVQITDNATVGYLLLIRRNPFMYIAFLVEEAPVQLPVCEAWAMSSYTN